MDHREPLPETPIGNANANLGKAVPPLRAHDMTAGQPMGPMAAPSPGITLDTIDELMRYQPWGHFQQESGDQVREAVTLAAKVILRTCPAGRFRSEALSQLLQCRMNANAAISFSGRF